MASPLPPDPYIALGVAKDATSAQIKSTYRKLVLKCHPDKVTDESLKAKAADDFHRIQQAYEIIGDDERRGRYDAQVKLAELRKEVMQKQRTADAHVNVKTAAYEVPTESPGRTAFTARGPERYEERKPSRAYEDHYDSYFPETRSTPRKSDDSEKMARGSPLKDERGRGKSDRSDKENDKAMKSDRRRTREKDIRRDRDDKRSYVDDIPEVDESPRPSRYEDPRRRDIGKERERERERGDRDRGDRDRGDRERRERERPRERDSERYTSQSRKQPDIYEDRTSNHLSKTLEGARSYIESNSRPAPSRANSLRDPHNVDVQRNRDGVPVMVRRPSAHPRHSARDISPPKRERERERDRKYSVADVDFAESRERRNSRERRIPTLQTSSSSPAAIKSVRERGAPSRSRSLQLDPEHHIPPPPRQMHRSETMPNVSPRKDASAPVKSSNLRHTEINEGLPTPSTTPEYVSPTTPYPTTRHYRYAASERDSDDMEVPSGRRTVVREPAERERDRDRRLTRSPSPIRTTRSNGVRYTAAPPPPPPIRPVQQSSYYPQSESPTSYSRPSPVRRESDRLFGEVSSKASAAPSPSSTSRIYDYADRDRERERDVPRQSQRYSPDLDYSAGKKTSQEEFPMHSGNGYYNSSSSSSRRGGPPPSSRPALGRSVASAY